MSNDPQKKRPQRLFQGQFDESFAFSKPQEVTPAGFRGLGSHSQRHEGLVPDTSGSGLGRFVREVREEVVIDSPQAAARYLLEKVFAPFDQFDQEELWVLLLNNKNRITHAAMVYRGTVNTVLIRSSELFKEAVRVNSTALILSHCHPSGDPTPSPNDIQVTTTAYDAAELLGIELLDHVVVGKGRWVSLKERGYFKVENGEQK